MSLQLNNARIEVAELKPLLRVEVDGTDRAFRVNLSDDDRALLADDRFSRLHAAFVESSRLPAVPYGSIAIPE